MNQLINTVLISGSGQNCGKTTLVCKLIQTLSGRVLVVGLKITPHFHQTGDNQTLVEKGSGYKIYRENDMLSGKDTSRMLNAGADEVYFLQCEDSFLNHAVETFYKLISKDSKVVCESGSLGLHFKPDYHVLVKGLYPDETKKSYKQNKTKADLIIKTGQIGSQMAEQIISSGNLLHHNKTIYYDQARRSA